MKVLQNLHTHSSFCDGRDTPEELILTAIDKGFTSIGFSGHSYMHYSPSHSMSLEGTEDYIGEIRRLKEKYSGALDIYLGLELDLFSTPIDFSQYEYIIGSVHYLKINGEYIGFDRSQAEVERVINTHFCGDGMAYAKAYYETLSLLSECERVDIIGHLDLITKHSENTVFFDTSSPIYRRYASDCIESLKAKIPYFEVNTGAIARGYRKSPYPDRFILNLLREMGFGAVISSDCHDASMLDCAFELSRELLLSCGFKEQYILTKDGFSPIPL